MPRSSRAWQIFGATLVLIGVAAVVGFWLWTRSPQYAIRQIGAAFKAHDIQSFKKYVDLDGVAADTVSLVQATRSDGSGLGAALAVTMTGPLQETAKRSITNFVETGGSGPVILYDFLDVDSSFAGVDYVKRDGKIAVVGLRFMTPHRATKAHVYEVRMRDLGSHWQVAGVNVRQLVEAKAVRDAAERLRTEQLEAERIAKQAASMRLSLSNAEVVAGPEGSVIGMLAISEPAPASIAAYMSAESIVVSVPSVVTIPAGHRYASFTVRTFEVPSPVRVTIHANIRGIELSTPLLLNPPQRGAGQASASRPSSPQSSEYVDYEDVYLDGVKREFHVSTCETAKAAAKGQKPTWNYRAMVAQGIPRAKDCANLPLPVRDRR